MKVGDLVRRKRFWIEGFGIVIEKGVYAGNRDVKIMWGESESFAHSSESLEVVSELSPCDLPDM